MDEPMDLDAGAAAPAEEGDNAAVPVRPVDIRQVVAAHRADVARHEPIPPPLRLLNPPPVGVAGVVPPEELAIMEEVYAAAVAAGVDIPQPPALREAAAAAAGAAAADAEVAVRYQRQRARERAREADANQPPRRRQRGADEERMDELQRQINDAFDRAIRRHNRDNMGEEQRRDAERRAMQMEIRARIERMIEREAVAAAMDMEAGIVNEPIALEHLGIRRRNEAAGWMPIPRRWRDARNEPPAPVPPPPPPPFMPLADARRRAARMEENLARLEREDEVRRREIALLREDDAAAADRRIAERNLELMRWGQRAARPAAAPAGLQLDDADAAADAAGEEEEVAALQPPPLPEDRLRPEAAAALEAAALDAARLRAQRQPIPLPFRPRDERQPPAGIRPRHPVGGGGPGEPPGVFGQDFMAFGRIRNPFAARRRRGPRPEGGGESDSDDDFDDLENLGIMPRRLLDMMEGVNQNAAGILRDLREGREAEARGAGGGAALAAPAAVAPADVVGVVEEAPPPHRDSLDEIRNHATCPVCYEEFAERPDERLPRVLSCGHLLCSGCMEHMRSARAPPAGFGAYSRNRKIQCPVCRKHSSTRVPVVKEVLYLMQQVEMVSKQDRPIDPIDELRADARKEVRDMRKDIMLNGQRMTNKLRQLVTRFDHAQKDIVGRRTFSESAASRVVDVDDKSEIVGGVRKEYDRLQGLMSEFNELLPSLERIAKELGSNEDKDAVNQAAEMYAEPVAEVPPPQVIR